MNYLDAIKILYSIVGAVILFITFVQVINHGLTTPIALFLGFAAVCALLYFMRDNLGALLKWTGIVLLGIVGIALVGGLVLVILVDTAPLSLPMAVILGACIIGLVIRNNQKVHE
jgi:ABC-type Fe3+-siderophore transport system permease subunit